MVEHQLVLIVATVVITPAVMVINVIWWTTELHTKYYFLVANLLVTDIVVIMNRVTVQYLVMILYLLDLDSESAGAVLQLVVFPTILLTHLLIILLPATLTLERMIVIVFPYCHRSIMTAKTVISMLAAMWGLSLILVLMITIIVPADIIWPLALNYHPTVIPFFVLPQLRSISSAYNNYQCVPAFYQAEGLKRMKNWEMKKLNNLRSWFNCFVHRLSLHLH